MRALLSCPYTPQKGKRSIANFDDVQEYVTTRYRRYCPSCCNPGWRGPHIFPEVPPPTRHLRPVQPGANRHDFIQRPYDGASA